MYVCIHIYLKLIGRTETKRACGDFSQVQMCANTFSTHQLVTFLCLWQDLVHCHWGWWHLLCSCSHQQGLAGQGLGAAKAVSDHVTKQSSNKKLIRKQSGKRVVLSSSDSLQHNSDSNALPYVDTFVSAPIQMQVAGCCKAQEVSLPSHHLWVLWRVTYSSGHCPSPPSTVRYSPCDSGDGTRLPGFPSGCTSSGCGSRGWRRSTSRPRTAGPARRPGGQHSTQQIKWIINVGQK